MCFIAEYFVLTFTKVGARQKEAQCRRVTYNQRDKDSSFNTVCVSLEFSVAVSKIQGASTFQILADKPFNKEVNKLHTYNQ